MMAWTVQNDTNRTRFNRLVQDLVTGHLQRNSFLRWEVDLLLEIESSPFRRSELKKVLRRYQRAVNRFLESGGQQPFSLSEYIRRSKRATKESAPMIS